MSKFFDMLSFKAIALFLCVTLDLLPLSRTLLCYTCLRMDCKGDDQICQDIRKFVVDQLRDFYYIDPYGTLPDCPAVDDVVAWKFLQVGTDPCRFRRAEEATCALSRMQIIAEASEDEKLTTFATVMGCAQYNLLKIVKSNEVQSTCPLAEFNATDRGTHLRFSYQLETCNIITEYCMDKDFCVAPSQSEVRPFKEQKKDKSFDHGFIIGIIVVTVVVMAAFIFASICRSPMSWASNTYHVSEQHVNIVE